MACPTASTHSCLSRVRRNLSCNEVDVLDAKVKYSFDLGDIGYFSTQLSSTYYSKYEYTGFDKGVSGRGWLAERRSAIDK